MKFLVIIVIHGQVTRLVPKPPSRRSRDSSIGVTIFPYLNEGIQLQGKLEDPGIPVTGIQFSFSSEKGPSGATIVLALVAS